MLNFRMNHIQLIINLQFMFQNKMYQSNHKHNKCSQVNNNKTSNQEHKE